MQKVLVLCPFSIDYGLHRVGAPKVFSPFLPIEEIQSRNQQKA